VNRLFSVPKVGAFVDNYKPTIEKRGGDEQTVLKVTFRVEPFDADLAVALDEGVGGDSNIRPTIFSLTTGEAKPNFTKHEFKLGLPRQTLELFASTDTPGSRLALNQAKISGCRVRCDKDSNALAMVFAATFGPVGRDELEAVHALYRRQTFITFHEAEPLLEEEADGNDDEGTDADVKAQTRAPFEFDDEPKAEPEEGPTTREIGTRHKLHSHQSKKKTAGKKKAAKS
jgi:hypothetical protein